MAAARPGLYRALRLLAEIGQGRLIATLAAEGGLSSTLWAGPEAIGRAVRAGAHPIEGTLRTGSISLRLGYSGDDYGYAIDLGLPVPGRPFPLDPLSSSRRCGPASCLGRATMFAERRGPLVRVRRARDGVWQNVAEELSAFDSMITQLRRAGEWRRAARARERMRDWRFYDALRTDPGRAGAARAGDDLHAGAGQRWRRSGGGGCHHPGDRRYGWRWTTRSSTHSPGSE